MIGTPNEERFSRRRRPVLVLPGYQASDRSTLPLRQHLRLFGHPVHRWGLGRNDGPTDRVRNGLRARFEQLADRHGLPIALVGWSLGGVYAWGLADRYPDQVGPVITLGSPLRSTAVTEPPAEVPVTSIWTRWDVVVPWRDSTIADGPLRENIEVRSTHVTLGVDPLVLHAVTDRLGRPPGEWAPFEPPGLLTLGYPSRRRDGVSRGRGRRFAASGR